MSRTLIPYYLNVLITSYQSEQLRLDHETSLIIHINVALQIKQEIWHTESFNDHAIPFTMKIFVKNEEMQIYIRQNAKITHHNRLMTKLT
jgi:hypothetical protein